MELVRGIRITDYCDQNNLPNKERLLLFIQVCQAIQHAHQKGIIHRDIKPSNILVTLQDGGPVPKVIDFGIAKATESRLTDATVYTQLNQFIGTPAYMSPEQAGMNGLDIDTRSDIYSLGVLLYELLVGRTPFDAKELLASGLEVMRQTIRDQEPLRPSTKLGTLPGEELTTTAKRRSVETSKLISQLKGDLDWIVMKCLEKDRMRRYETANGVAADLKRHLDNEPVVAGPPSSIYRLKKFIVRNKWPVILNTTVAALTVAGLIGTSLGLRRATIARRLADQNATRADQNATRAGQLASEAKKAELAARVAETNALHLAYSASMLSACDALEHWQIDSARHYLETAPPDLRGWEWRHLSSRLDLSIRTHDHSRSNVSLIHVAPDGRSYYEVSVSPAQGIRRWDTDTGQLLATFPATHSYAGSWLVAGGKQLIAQIHEGRPGPVEVWDLERATRLCSFPATDDAQAAPDGSCFACVHEQMLQIVDTRSGATRVCPTTVTSSSALHTMCFQPDGRRLAVCSRLGDVALLDTASLEILSTFKAHENTIASMAFSADSRLLATGSLDTTIRITDVTVNPPAAVATLRGHAGAILALSFSPDASLLAAAGADRIQCLWETRTGSPRGVFESDGLAPSFLPDGRTLVNGDSKGVRFWDVRSLGATVLSGHRSFVYPVLVSPDGATIYSGGWDGFVAQPGSLRFWDAATGDPIAATGATNEYVRGAALSVDGSRLAISVRAANESFNRIDILDTATGTPVASVRELGEKSSVPLTDSLAFDPAAQDVFCVNYHDGVAYLVDARTGVPRKSRQVLGGGISSRVAWSPDGATIAVGYGEEGGGVVLLDPQSLDPVRRWPHGHGKALTSVAFSPDSRRLLTTSQDQIVRVWDAVTGTRLHDLVGHGSIVFCAVYSPDGTRIASGGRDDNVRIWDAETFEPVARLGGHEDYVYSLAWRGDSQQLLSGSGDHTVRIWDTVPMKDRMQARRERQAILAQVEPMVKRLFAEFGDGAKVVEKVKADVSLSARARQVALQAVLRTSLDRQNTPPAQPHP